MLGLQSSPRKEFDFFRSPRDIESLGEHHRHQQEPNHPGVRLQRLPGAIRHERPSSLRGRFVGEQPLHHPQCEGAREGDILTLLESDTFYTFTAFVAAEVPSSIPSWPSWPQRFRDFFRPCVERKLWGDRRLPHCWTTSNGGRAGGRRFLLHLHGPRGRRGSGISFDIASRENNTSEETVIASGAIVDYRQHGEQNRSIRNVKGP